nr:26S proteasome non-ATPase regulatory subunit 4 [Tanacetum cinerariifolium]
MEQIEKQQSISKTEAEVTVICVDNTALVTERAGVYIAQAMAITLYCDEKIKAHPDNMVALVPMGPLQGSSHARPTRDLDEILFALKGLLYWGQICIPTRDALIYKSDISKNQDSKGRSSMYAYFLDESQPRST